MLTQARLKELLSYDPETGIFIRLVNRQCVKAGDIAGSISSEGYLTVYMDGRSYKCHRLAWFYMTGEWPKGEIDHIDGKRANNAFSNLRDVSKNANIQNQKKPQSRNKSSGYLGVFKNYNSNKFMARITVNNRKIYLGSFSEAEDAHEAYLKAKRELHEGCTI